MDLPLLQYPLDPTGKNPDNLVHGEIHNLPNRNIRAIAPTYGAFFTEDLKVVDNVTQVELIKGTQYVTVDLVQTATEVYGKEICSVILIIDKNVNSSVLITYQALGGMYTKNFSGIVSYLNTLAMDQRPAAWPDIINRPKEFIPTKHLHDIGDVYGFEYITYALERIRNAIMMTNDPVIDQILKYIDDSVATFNTDLSRLSSDVSGHIADKNNPHTTTKAQVGLSYVENMRLGSEAEAQNAATSLDTALPATVFPENKYVSLRGLMAFKNRLFDRINTSLATHIVDKNNPHAVTKLQVGLGDVENHPVVTPEQIKQNIPNDNYVTFNRLRNFADEYLIANNRKVIDLTGLSTDYFFPVWWMDSNTLDAIGVPSVVNITRPYYLDWEKNPLNLFYTEGIGAGTIDTHQAGLSFTVNTNGCFWSGASENIFEVENLGQVYNETIRIPRYGMKCYYKYLNRAKQNFPRWYGWEDGRIFSSPANSGCYLRGGFTYYFNTTNNGVLESMKYSRDLNEVELFYYPMGPGWYTNPWEIYPRDNREMAAFTKAFHKDDPFLEGQIEVFGATRPQPGRPPHSEAARGLYQYESTGILNLNGVKNPFLG